MLCRGKAGIILNGPYNECSRPFKVSQEISIFVTSVRILIRDPVPFLFFFVHPGSGKNTPDHISESLEIIFWG
jgi:hypothetical protein